MEFGFEEGGLAGIVKEGEGAEGLGGVARACGDGGLVGLGAFRGPAEELEGAGTVEGGAVGGQQVCGEVESFWDFFRLAGCGEGFDPGGEGITLARCSSV